MNAPLASATYAALRHGGAPPAHAQAQVGVSPQVGRRLERLFQRRGGGRFDAMRPRFAHHDAHIRAALAEGGFPVLPERRR